MKYIDLIIFLAGPLLAQAQMVPNTEDWSKMPAIVDPKTALSMPSDAEILFDGTDLSAWSNANGEDSDWEVEKNVLTIVPGTGDIFTRKSYGDVQLHVEWKIPEENSGHGNSGIYLQGRYEVQIYNSHKNNSPIYYNGQAGSIYKQYKPMVNVCLPPGSWETFDIFFFAPRFDGDSLLVSPARMTVVHNGVLIHHNAILKGTTTHLNATGYEVHPPKQPLLLQDHGDIVSFRNLWIREL